MIGLKEIMKVQGQGDFAANRVRIAETLMLEVIDFLCCNKLMRLLRFLFRKKFDEQYNKLMKAGYWLTDAEDALDDQWNLLEEYFDKTCKEELEEELKD